MSRKRKLKKQHKRRSQWLENLEDLYLRRADRVFLETARLHFQELDAASMAGPYREVTDRVLVGALTDGDPQRVSERLALIRRDAVPRPLVLLAEAVDLLAQGRREPAAARLAALDDVDEAALGAARHLPERLRMLAFGKSATDPGIDDRVPWRELGEVARLSRILETHAVSDTRHPEGEQTQRLPRSLELNDPATRAAWHFYRALAAVARRDFQPGTKTLSALAQATETLERTGPVNQPWSRLIRGTKRRLGVLAELRKLEQTIRRRTARPRSRRGGKQVEDLLLERLDTGELSAKLLHDDPPALLRPLQHALRMRWHRLLERRGAASLAVLFAARPEVLAVDLEAGAEAVEARRWAEVKTLLKSRSFGELATFLRSAAERAETGQRLATLWSLELWARQEDAEETDLEQAHMALVRLIAMAVAVNDRFTAPERLQVARFLRDELLNLCSALDVCGHFLDAAKALLEHLGDDPGLLAVALAGAVSSRDARTRHEVTARIAARGRALADQETLLRLTENLAAERPADTVPVLTAIEPLFTGASWSEMLDRVAPEAMDEIRGGLIIAAGVAIEDSDQAKWILGEVRQDLELYRPLLDGRPELAALDLAIDGYGAAPSVAKLGVGKFLQRFEGLEAALVLYRQALQLSDAGVYPEIDTVLVEAVVDRLDARWPLWVQYLTPLTFDATGKQFRKLQKRIRGVLKDTNLEVGDQQALREILEKMGRLRKVKRPASALPPDLDLPGLESPQKPKSRKPRTRRPKPVDDRQLDLFGTE